MGLEDGGLGEEGRLRAQEGPRDIDGQEVLVHLALGSLELRALLVQSEGGRDWCLLAKLALNDLR